MIRKILLGIAIALVVIVGGLLLVINLRWDRTFEAPYPAITATTDSAAIARGRYLAYGPAHCASCHVSPADSAALMSGGQPPLAGGYEFAIPPGKFYTPNLTPDSATGIGRRTDGELARILRHSVRADGRSAVPFMESQDASDEDLVALISFLRSQPAVRHEVSAHKLNLMGKAVMSFMITPVGPKATPPAQTPSAVGVERGEYMANGLASCVGCHTERSMATGAFTGPAFAGGAPMEISGDPTREIVPPNLTPDTATGRITAWTEEAFVARFQAGRAITESPMPWEFFARSSEDDLRSIYRYLMSLAPIHRETGPSIRPTTTCPNC
jgi:mono/diheme cytochrome c family protein